MVGQNCIVPLCINSSTKTPEKLFFNVPNNEKERKEWIKATKRADNSLSAKSHVSCCEDHFDLETDMENYVKYKLVGGKQFLKKGVVPHKFLYQKPKAQTVMEFDQPKLIAEVKKRLGLWSTEHPVDRDEKLAMWKEVGAAMFKDWHECSKATAYDRVLHIQRKWRSLRDAYRREVRSRTSGIRVNKTVYRYYRLMSFLGGYEGPDDANEQERIVPENNDSIEENQDGIEIETLEDELLEPNDTDPDPLLAVVSSSKQRNIAKRSKRIKAKKRKVELTNDNEEPVYTVDVRGELEPEADSDKLFLMSFLPEMKQLPVNIKMWVRAQIANIMQEAVSCHYNNSTPEGMVKRQRQDSSE